MPLLGSAYRLVYGGCVISGDLIGYVGKRRLFAYNIEIWDRLLLVSVPCADPDPFLNLLDCLVDYMDRVASMPAFVMRGLTQL
jgi:hypothetical protein